MASRSSTGVIVALVVFVVLSVSLLAVSIILYTDKSKAELSASEANAELNKFITAEERSRTETEAMLGQTSDKSLFAFLTEQGQEVAAFVSGNRTADVSEMRKALTAANKDFADTDTVSEGMRKLAQDRDSRKQAEEALKAKSSDLTKELDALKQRVAAAEASHAEAIAKVTATIATYQQAADGYRGEFDSAKSALDESRADQKARFDSESAALQSDIDSLRSERAVLDSRISKLQSKIASSSTRAGNPAALIDCRVVDVDPKTGTIFIDIGSNRRVVPGMTFEVFDDAAGIVASAASDTGARGKASVQVIKVNDSTSTCRVVRGSSSRPIVKDDVLANAVFNPDATFKFLVHGKFDVNDDGKSTAGEADYIKSRIEEWGGTVVVGDTLTGDLDFLVLGVQPPLPAPLSSNATEAQTLAYTDQRAARELYDQLFKTASDAQIPVLNWSRFEALTGTVNR